MIFMKMLHLCFLTFCVLSNLYEDKLSIVLFQAAGQTCTMDVKTIIVIVLFVKKFYGVWLSKQIYNLL